MEDNKVEQVFIDIKPKKKKPKLGLTKTGKLVFGFLALCILLFVSAFIYFKSDSANVKSIKVVGNDYLQEDFVISLSEISEDNKYLFLFAKFKEKKMMKSPLISSAKIELGKNHSVLITIEENKVMGYKIAEKTSLFLADGQQVDFDAKYIKNLALLPLFTDVLPENIPAICKSLAEIDDDVLMRISEVGYLSFTYDSNMVKLVMDDGHYVYSSIKGLRYLNSYLDLLINQKNSKNKCFLILDEYHSAVNSDCSELDKYQVSKDQQPENGQGEG